MNIRKVALATLALTVASASVAMASNEMILLNPDDFSQLAIVDIIGNDNRLIISQKGPAGQQGNSVNVSITGNNNGGPVGAQFTGAAAAVGIAPGRLVQEGFGNTIQVAAIGDGNLFAVSQMGSDNVVRGTITGANNQAAVMQVGVGNFTSFSQSGFGNNISVQQTSW